MSDNKDGQVITVMTHVILRQEMREEIVAALEAGDRLTTLVADCVAACLHDIKQRDRADAAICLCCKARFHRDSAPSPEPSSSPWRRTVRLPA
jgi:hypothetical protein